MGADAETGAATGQIGWPNLKSGRDGWKPGSSGNPLGMSKYHYELRQAVERQETPERVCQVVDAMFKMALKGTKASPAAAKAYAMLVGVEQGDPERITKAVQAHLQTLLLEAERVEAIEQERRGKVIELPAQEVTSVDRDR